MDLIALRSRPVSPIQIHLPGYIGPVANDILSAWFRMTGIFKLTSSAPGTGANVHITAKTVAGTTAPTWDLMRSTNGGSSFSSLLPSGNSNKIVLAVGNNVSTVTDRSWQVTQINAGDLLRVDLLVTDDGSGQDVEIVIEPAP